MLKIVIIMSLITNVNDSNTQRPIEYREEVFSFVQPDMHTDLTWLKLEEEFKRYEEMREKVVKEIDKISKDLE